jgi:hypothetical protein
MEDAGMTHADDEGRIWEVDNHFEEMTFWYRSSSQLSRRSEKLMRILYRQVPNSGDEDTNLPATLTEWSALAHAVRASVCLSPSSRTWVRARACPTTDPSLSRGRQRSAETQVASVSIR